MQFIHTSKAEQVRFKCDICREKEGINIIFVQNVDLIHITDLKHLQSMQLIKYHPVTEGLVLYKLYTRWWIS